jgi:hypothetical protein
MLMARKLMATASMYDHAIVNDNLDESYETLRKVSSLPCWFPMGTT